jgi:hypothetical protein
MSTKNLRYSLSLSRLPLDCRSLAKRILANEQSNNERSFLNSILAYGFMYRRERNSNFFTTSFIGNMTDEKTHQFSMPMVEENISFIEHINRFKQGKNRTTEYNYLLFCGFNAFIDICKKYIFCEKYILVSLLNETKKNIYLSGLYPFFLTLKDQLILTEPEERYFFEVFKTTINEDLNRSFNSYLDFKSCISVSGDLSDTINTKQIPQISNSDLDQAKITTIKTEKMKPITEKTKSDESGNPATENIDNSVVAETQEQSISDETGPENSSVWENFSFN